MVALRLDYCNANLYLFPFKINSETLLVQNAAAGLFLGTWQCMRSTPTLQSLH